MNENLRKFLDMIGQAEGADYSTGFGGYQFDPAKGHPGFSHGATYKGQKNSAAGKYQINKATYDDFAKKLGVTGFSPADQDKIAIGIIQQEGALDDVNKGDWQAAIAKLGNRWASLPSSTAGQPTKSYAQLAQYMGNPSGGKAQVPVHPMIRGGQPVVAIPDSQEEAEQMAGYHNAGYDDLTQSRLIAGRHAINQAKRAVGGTESLYSDLPTDLDDDLLKLIERV